MAENDRATTDPAPCSPGEKERGDGEGPYGVPEPRPYPGMTAARYFQTVKEKAGDGTRDGDAAFRLALCYRDGYGVEKSTLRFLSHLIDAELWKAPGAHELLGRQDVDEIYRLGEKLTAAERWPAAFRFFRTAARMGKAHAWACLGDQCLRGRGLPRSPEIAAQMFFRGAEAGDACCQRALARLYETGTGLPRDPDKAARWLRRAAAQDGREKMPTDGMAHGSVPFPPEKDVEVRVK